MKGPRELADKIWDDCKSGKIPKIDIDIVRRYIREDGQEPHEALELHILRRIVGRTS